MPIYLTEHRLAIIDRILSDAGLDRRDFGWWREQGGPAGYEWEYEPGEWGALPVEANRFRHNHGPFEFAIVGAIGRDTFVDDATRVRLRNGDPIPETGNGLFHVWGHADRWLVPGDPTVSVPFPELISRFRAWIEQVVAHLGIIPEGERSHGPQFIFQNSMVGALLTGHGASLTLLTSVNPETASLVSSRLREFEAELDQRTDLDPDRVSIIREAIDSAVEEASRARPNPISLGGTIAGLAAASQGLAAWPQAYQVLKSIAGLIGLKLP